MKPTILVLSLLLSYLALAIDMPAQTEQYYVVQGLFSELGISPIDCNIEDDKLNFACGSYTNGTDAFRQGLDAYVSNNLPGLFLYQDWFVSAESLVKQYQSVQGRYYFAINPDGTVIFIFEPF